MKSRRSFLAGLDVGLLGTQLIDAQTPPSGQAPPAPGAGGGRGDSAPPVRAVKTTPLFESPELYPNAIAAAADGLWIAEQKSDHAHLVDWNGKLLKTGR